MMINNYNDRDYHNDNDFLSHGIDLLYTVLTENMKNERVEKNSKVMLFLHKWISECADLFVMVCIFRQFSTEICINEDTFLLMKYHCIIQNSDNDLTLIIASYLSATIPEFIVLWI